MAKPTWIPQGADYSDSTGTLVAVYRRTTRGHAEYWTFPTALPKSKRTLGRAVCVGGLYQQDMANLNSRVAAVMRS